MSSLIVKSRIHDFLSQIKHESYIITDDNVFKIVKKELKDFHFKVIPAGEASKNMQTISDIIESMLEINMSRNVEVIGIGGGVVCDISGFVSKIYKRGCSLSLIPTTLLAMVDAAIGGKNGVNSNNYKNQIGSYKLPKRIIIDVDVLYSLPKNELVNGFAEMIKYGLLEDKNFYEKLINKSTEIFSNRIDFWINNTDLITQCIEYKNSYVKKDLQDNGIRKKLNFGHTFGHAIESVYKYSHGESVIHGMLVALKISRKKKILCEDLYYNLYDVISCFDKIDVEYDWEKLFLALSNDKKRINNNLQMILFSDFGKTQEMEISFEELKESLDNER